jgi:Mrp family chromosome partitioning ATPase
MSLPATHAEIEQIYLSAELNGCRSLCLTACQSGEGVTAVAMALTERYLLAGYRTVLVDLNLHHPGFSASTLNQHHDGDTWIEHTQSLRCFTGMTLPSDSSTQLIYKRPDFLQRALNEWQQQYDRVVIDTSPLLNVNRNNIPAQSVANACDATILVVLAGKTTATRVHAAMQHLNQGQITLLGTILNCRDQPTLASEICREIKRIPFLPQAWKNKLMKKIKSNEHLNTIS